MNTKPLFASLLAASALTLATAASAHGPTQDETVAKNFSHAIPNIPGKSLVAFETRLLSAAEKPPVKKRRAKKKAKAPKVGVAAPAAA